jgi:putative colanic acid biosynthesis acetyltransferase WcaF
MLRLLGAKIGHAVQIYATVEIFAPWKLEIGDESAVGHRAILYNLGQIKIGRQVTISNGAHLCAGTHDYTKPDLPLIKPPITIDDCAWICADAFVGPGVCVGEGAVVGAASVVVKDVPPWNVVAGNPAKTIKLRNLSR